jgi:hypothetical protein
MTLVMKGIAKSRHREPERVGDAHVLRNPTSVLWIAVVCIALFGGLAVTALLTNPEGRGVTYFFFFCAAALLGFYMLAEYLVVRHEVGEERFVFRTVSGKRGSAPWTDVVLIRYSPSLKWFVLHLRGGTTVRVSGMLIGLPHFAEVVLQRCPDANVDPVTRDVLTETAAGNPPPVW